MTAILLAFIGVLSFLLARNGTTRARVGSALAILASVLLALGWRWLDWWRLRAPERIVRGLAQTVDREGSD